jgi:hypothetical protein
MYKWMAVVRLNQTSANDAERPDRPRDEGIDFLILHCPEENAYSSTHEMTRMLAVAYSAKFVSLVREAPYDFRSHDVTSTEPQFGKHDRPCYVIKPMVEILKAVASADAGSW